MPKGQEEIKVKENNEICPKCKKPIRGEKLTITEAMEYIRLGRTSFHKCLRDGSIPYFRPSRGKILIDSADLDDWLKNAKVS